MLSKVHKIAIAAAFSSATFVASPAMATIIAVPASSIQGANVLFNSGTQTGTLVTGFTQSGTLVDFRGTTTASNVISANGGQARVEGELNTLTSNPNDTLGLTSLNFALRTGTFNNLELNLFGATGGGAVTFRIFDNENQLFTFANLVLGNGENFFGFQGIDGQSISRVELAIAPGSIQDVRQIRLDEVAAAVPEPGTWAMMLIGFGVVGAGMRRRRRHAATLMQVA